jgi:serine/threonine protein kinase
MSMTQTPIEQQPSADFHCPHCNASLPAGAMFCGSCGERLDQKKLCSLLQENIDIKTLYRIISLVRRRSYLSLYFAVENQRQRPVAIRDIDISSLTDEARLQASELIQREFDLLRREHIPHLMPVLDLRHYQNHLYVIAGQPFSIAGREKGTTRQLHTLHDLLQSGGELPSEPIALRWIDNLCTAVDRLHKLNIVIGDLDPQTIVFSGDSSDMQPMVMVSWLPLSISDLLPRPSILASTTPFSAPEVLLWKTDVRSDIYSLGAILYLLLTGTVPDEATQRTRQQLRSPGELNSRISSDVDEFVMRALALDQSQRFPSASTMLTALLDLHSSPARPPKILPPPVTPSSGGASDLDISLVNTQRVSKGDERHQAQPEEAGDITIRLKPSPQSSLLHWQAANAAAEMKTPQPASQQDVPSTPRETIEPLPDAEEPPASPSPATPSPDSTGEDAEVPLVQRLKQRITGILPAISPPPSSDSKEEDAEVPLVQRLKQRITGILPAIPRSLEAGHAQGTSSSPRTTHAKPLRTEQASTPEDSSFKRFQRMLLGEQHHTSTVAAIIETPLRIQPHQHYAVRIHLLGRAKPTGTKKDRHHGGLSSLPQGALVYIEIRSALYQNFAYIVQQTAVHIPQGGFASEVTIPMHPLSSGPSGRRDRLHIFFTDEQHHPLYEKPFVVEIFISHLVQSGREGHNVLTIPL